MRLLCRERSLGELRSGPEGRTSIEHVKTAFETSGFGIHFLPWAGKRISVVSPCSSKEQRVEITEAGLQIF